MGQWRSFSFKPSQELNVPSVELNGKLSVWCNLTFFFNFCCSTQLAASSFLQYFLAESSVILDSPDVHTSCLEFSSKSFWWIFLPSSVNILHISGNSPEPVSFLSTRYLLSNSICSVDIKKNLLVLKTPSSSWSPKSLFGFGYRFIFQYHLNNSTWVFSRYVLQMALVLLTWKFQSCEGMKAQAKVPEFWSRVMWDSIRFLVRKSWKTIVWSAKVKSML